MSATPAGFVPSERTGPFFDLIGPIHTKPSETGVILGLCARREHCNARGLVHGAIFAAVLDAPIADRPTRALATRAGRSWPSSPGTQRWHLGLGAGEQEALAAVAVLCLQEG